MVVATLNVRLPQDLKDRGMQVLEREGISVSEVVRDLFRYLEETQTLPEFAAINQVGKKGLDVDQKRAAMQSMIGILPSDVDAETARRERLERKLQTGVRV